MKERFPAEVITLLPMAEIRKMKKENEKNVNVKVGTVKAANDASGGGDEGGKADGFAPGGNDARGLGNKAALTK